MKFNLGMMIAAFIWFGAASAATATSGQDQAGDTAAASGDLVFDAGEYEEGDALVIIPSTTVDTDTYADLENVDVIRTEDGELMAPWKITQACSAGVCGELIADGDTGEVAAFDGDWMGGFVATGRGEQIIRLRLE